MTPLITHFWEKSLKNLWNFAGIYIYEGDGSGYWDISLDFLTPVERNENALSGNLF